MIDQKKRTYHFETSSLLPLKLVLIEAEKESHLYSSQKQTDVNEELALKLIANMKKKYRKAMSLRGAFVATKQSPRRVGDCFVGKSALLAMTFPTTPTCQSYSMKKRSDSHQVRCRIAVRYQCAELVEVG